MNQVGKVIYKAFYLTFSTSLIGPWRKSERRTKVNEDYL